LVRDQVPEADGSGAGPIGLLCLLCARAAGAHPIILTDVVPSRLEFARTLVPTVQAVLVAREDNGEAAERVRQLSGGGVMAALECTGLEASIATAIFVSPPESGVS
jgi:L-iditol 2-dehydrogenase